MELHIRDVSRTYPNGVQARKDVTLTIPPGMYGLLGPNGAGKSTLMRIAPHLTRALAEYHGRERRFGRVPRATPMNGDRRRRSV